MVYVVSAMTVCTMNARATPCPSVGLWRLVSRLLGWTDETDEKDPEQCQQYVKRIPSEMGTINIYEIYVSFMLAQHIRVLMRVDPVCMCGPAATPWSGPAERRHMAAAADLCVGTGLLTLRVMRVQADVCLPGRSSARRLGELMPDTPIGAAINGAHSNAMDPCIDNEVELYANRPEVPSDPSCHDGTCLSRSLRKSLQLCDMSRSNSIEGLIVRQTPALQFPPVTLFHLN